MGKTLTLTLTNPSPNGKISFARKYFSGACFRYKEHILNASAMARLLFWPFSCLPKHTIRPLCVCNIILLHIYFWSRSSSLAQSYFEKGHLLQEFGQQRNNSDSCLWWKVSIVSIVSIKGKKSISVVESQYPRVDTNDLLLLLTPIKSEVHLNATNTPSYSPTPTLNPQP